MEKLAHHLYHSKYALTVPLTHKRMLPITATIPVPQPEIISSWPYLTAEVAAVASVKGRTEEQNYCTC